MKEVAGMLKRRFANIITYLKHRITNATSESINAKIQWVKYTARGFRNKQNFINAIYFHCGGSISPQLPLNSRKRQYYINGMAMLVILCRACYAECHFANYLA